MAFLNYEYRMKISYAEPVDRCYFTIKGIPADDFRQRSISYDICVRPDVAHARHQDSFGNKQIIGSVRKPHSEFEYVIKGLVETYPVSTSGGIHFPTLGMYRYPFGKCIPGEAIRRFASELEDQVKRKKDDKEKAFFLMNRLYEGMTYETGSTRVETSAEEAFTNGKGVCQDYAHIFICLLRLFSIPARYVCGIMEGEGKSHAWVEAACDENFVAFDPTHNREISDEYIKFGVGRDATDCAINRGVMWGGGSQLQEIYVSVERHF